MIFKRLYKEVGLGGGVGIWVVGSVWGWFIYVFLAGFIVSLFFGCGD